LPRLPILIKLYLAYLRAVRGVIEGELLCEEARYKWFMENTIEVISTLKGLNYTLYKFRKPVEHVSVDLDVLIDRGMFPGLFKHWSAGGLRWLCGSHTLLR